MTPVTYTTQDLRAALQESADTVGDLSELRQRLDERLDQRLNEASRESGDFVPLIGDSATVPVRKARRVWSSRPAQLLTGALLAACIAALALVVVQAPWQVSPKPATHPKPVLLPTPDPHLTVPPGLRNSLNPGSIPLRNFAGTGSQSIDLGPLVKVPNHTYWLYYTCSSGTIQITHFGGSACYKGYPGLGNPDAQRHVRILIGRDVAWHLLLVLVADPDSNAPGLLHQGGPTPVAAARSYVLQNGRHGWAKSGHGATIISIPSLARTAHQAVDLTCSGAGVHVSTFDGQISDDYTNTCWPGYIFQWQEPALHAPTMLLIGAPASTKWVISIGPG